jgi:Arc/MetJ-type ribon-helix-helix transcriptional regulator
MVGWNPTLRLATLPAPTWDDGGAAMGVHSVTLSDDEEAVLGGLVASGEYGDAAEALRAGLAALGRDKAEGDALLARIMVGYEQAERGEFVEGEAEEVVRRAFERAAAEWEAEHGVEAEAS